MSRTVKSVRDGGAPARILQVGYNIADTFTLHLYYYEIPMSLVKSYLVLSRKAPPYVLCPNYTGCVSTNRWGAGVVAQGFSADEIGHHRFFFHSCTRLLAQKVAFGAHLAQLSRGCALTSRPVPPRCLKR